MVVMDLVKEILVMVLHHQQLRGEGVLYFSIIFWLIAVVTCCCDLSAYLLDSKSSALLYSDESEVLDASSSVFGDSTITSQINESDLTDDDVKKQAEDMIRQLYEGR